MTPYTSQHANNLKQQMQSLFLEALTTAATTGPDDPQVIRLLNSCSYRMSAIQFLRMRSTEEYSTEPF